MERGNDVPDLISSLTTDEAVTFAKGDKVKVTEGDLAGLWGYVHNVRDDGTVEMMPQLKELTEVLPFPPSQLAKTFEVSAQICFRFEKSDDASSAVTLAFGGGRSGTTSR